MNKYVFMSTLVLFCTVSADDTAQAHAPQRGPITPQTIYAQSTQPSDELRRLIHDCVHHYEDVLPELIRPASEVPVMQEDQLEKLASQAYMLREKGIEFPSQAVATVDRLYDVPRNSFVLKCPGSVEKKEYALIAATNLHQRYNIEAYNGKPWGSGLTEHDKKPHYTYQTVSRAAHSVRLHNTIKEEGIQHFYAPAVYLAQVPARRPITEHASDENAVVVQEWYDDQVAQPLKYNLKKIESLSSQAMSDIFKAIKGGILWDAEHSILVDHDGNVSQHDVQQPNNMNPAVFHYHAHNPDEVLGNGMTQQEFVNYRLEHDVAAGIEGFIKNLQQARSEGHAVEEQCVAFANLVLHDTDIKNWKNEGLRNKLYELVNFVQQ